MKLFNGVSMDINDFGSLVTGVSAIIVLSFIMSAAIYIGTYIGGASLIGATIAAAILGGFVIYIAYMCCKVILRVRQGNTR